MAQTEQLHISRAAPNQPWGFRLQGGKDFNMPIIIQKVNGGSPAEKAGLRAGDAVISIGGNNAIEMRHKEAQDAIVHSGNKIDMVVQRGGLASLRPPSSAAPLPKPTQPRQRNPFRVIKNLETPDGSVKALVHNQFNSPMPLYSEEKIAETLSAQTEVLAGGALGVDFRKNEKKYDGNMSEVLRMVQDMDKSPEAYAEPEEVIDAASLPPEYTGLNSIKSRSMRSLVVKPDGHGAPQTSVHAPRITAPSAPKVAPPVAPKPAPPVAPKPAAGGRGPPGMRSTTATMIKTDPATGSVKLVSAVDTETKRFNAFNRTPQSFKDQAPAGGAPQTPPPVVASPPPDTPEPQPVRTPPAAAQPEPQPESPAAAERHVSFGEEAPLVLTDQHSQQPNQQQSQQQSQQQEEHQLAEQFQRTLAADGATRTSSFEHQESHHTQQSQQTVATSVETHGNATVTRTRRVVESHEQQQRLFQKQTLVESGPAGALLGQSPAALQLDDQSAGGFLPDAQSAGGFQPEGQSAGDFQIQDSAPAPAERVQSPPAPEETWRPQEQCTAAPAAPSYQPMSVPAPTGGHQQTLGQHQTHTSSVSQQQQSFTSGTSGISQVDYSSYVPQRKGGTTFAWPPQPTEPDSAPPPFAGGHVEVSRPAPAPAPAPAPKPAPPPVLPKPAPAASFAPPPAPAPAPAPPKQVHFGQPSFAPAVAPKPAPPSSGAPPKLGFNGGLPGLGGLGGGGAPASGKGATAGRTNAPRRGRGQMNPAATGSRIPICATCGNQIRGPFITALGQCWCPGCFVCATPQCRQSLEFIGFVEVDGKTHCENCWERHLAPVCNKCQRRIKEDCLKAIGKSYHPECFACAYCGGLFGNSAFFLEDGLPYCENDWNELFTTKCVGCGFPIEAGDRWVEALNKNFHSQCFKCAICGNNLEGQSFFAKQGRPFCKHHARV